MFNTTKAPKIRWYGKQEVLKTREHKAKIYALTNKTYGKKAIFSISTETPEEQRKREAEANCPWKKNYYR
jgi:hypothetical protein